MDAKLGMELAVLLVLSYGVYMGCRRGILLTLLLLVRRVLMLVLGYAIWRILMAMVPKEAPYLVSGTVFSVALILAGVVFRILQTVLKIADRIPVVKQVNHILGLLAGALLGLVNVWVAFVIIRVFQSAQFGKTLMQGIQSSAALRLLFRINPLLAPVNFVMGIAARMWGI